MSMSLLRTKTATGSPDCASRKRICGEDLCSRPASAHLARRYEGSLLGVGRCRCSMQYKSFYFTCPSFLSQLSDRTRRNASRLRCRNDKEWLEMRSRIFPTREQRRCQVAELRKRLKLPPEVRVAKRDFKEKRPGKPG
jgi:hypothetical protein